MTKLKYSIIVPTYNEEKDISKLLQSLKSMKSINIEVIFVDDSSDQTPNIIEKFMKEDNRIKLIKPEIRQGRCEARNIGILSAKHKILVILNADVLLSDNFLNKIDKHYKKGAEALIVKSKVINMNSVYGRYVEAVNLVDYYDNPNIQLAWSEGFSCLKKNAVNAGLFPTGFSVQICAGEDAVFGKNLKTLGTKINHDYSIIIKHYAPDNFKDFWQIRKGRGQGFPQIKHYILGKLLSTIWILLIAKSTLFLFKTLLIFPFLFRSNALCKSINGTKTDFLRFYFIEFLVSLAFIYGAILETIKIGKLDN